LLNSTDIATVFLDSALRIRRFTVRATSLIQLIPGDVGRPVTDLASDLLYQGLPEDAREVLRTLGHREKEIAIKDGRWFTVRILPYRTFEDKIDGVVLTFTEITAAKTQESELRQALAEHERGRAHE
ncbi:MAG TPA: PAS domain-containing protein, partial [Candidatus Methylomirabilis sp.]|nr:PAS domain-containing protein [Candidatus Methylomirabilis sp.]